MKFSFRTLPVATILLILQCGTTIPVKVPRFPSGTTGDQLKTVMGTGRKIGIVALEPDQKVKGDFAIKDDWADTVEGTISTEFQRRGYFELVDIASRKQRLREVAYTQSGLTSSQKALGEEATVDGLLIISMTAAPRTECKTEMKTSAMAIAGTALQAGLAAYSNSRMGEVKTEKPTGVRFLTVFVQAKLVNMESGRSVAYTHTKPYKLENGVGNEECPSVLDALDKAMNQASKAIADNLSPSIIVVPIPLEEKTEGLSSGDAKTVTTHLKQGNLWASKGDFDMAVESWQNALDESNGKSQSALWNIAAFKWYSGDMDGAEQYFKKAMKQGAPGWINESARMTVWSMFKSEKNRLEKE